MRTLARLENSKDFWFLLITSFVFFLFRLPSLFEPYWYGDEGIYQVIGLALRNGRSLYEGIWDNKPPLFYYLYAIFNSDQFTLRFLSLIFGIFSVVVFFLLTKKLLKSQKKYFSLTFLFAIFTAIPLLEGNIANAENFMLLPIIASGLLIYNFVTTRNKKNFKIFIAGLLLSFAFLLKVVAVFDFAAFFLFILFSTYKKNVFLAVEKLLPFVFGFIAPLIITVLFFAVNGSFSDFIRAVFLQNVGYVGYENKLITPQGLLFLKLVILASLVFFLFLKRKSISGPALFIILWFSFSLFNAFFSQRPYTHYLLVLLPSLLLFVELVIFCKRYQKIGFASVAITFFLVLTGFNFYGKTFVYYQNFISFVLGVKNVSQYQAFFDRQTPIDYSVAQFIKANTVKSDNIFIWGNNAQLYKLADKLPPGRFIVAYHASNSEKTLKETGIDFYKAKPKYVIITSSKNFIPFSLVDYKQKIVIGNTLVYEKLF